MRLKEITIKNFMSFGNYPQTINLDFNNVAILKGTNGSGKSSISNAIAFALFGKPLKNINKKEIPNNINKKECLVKLKLETNNNNYEIIRGISPNIFEIYKNGELINKSSSVIDYQVILERDIIGYNFELFKQLVILSGSDFVPFLRMTQKNRRTILEELLSLTELTKMEKVLKGYIAENKSAIRETLAVLKELQESIKRQNELYKKSSKDTKEKIKEIKNKIKENQNKIKSIADNIKEKELEFNFNELERLENELKEINKKIKEGNINIGKLSTGISSLEQSIHYLDTNDSCQSCGQEIDKEFKRNKINELNTKKQKILEALNTIKEQESEYTIKLNELNNEINKLKSIKAFIDSSYNEIKHYKDTIDTLQSYINNIKETDNSNIKQEIITLTEKYSKLQDKLEKLTNESEIFQTARSFLSDDGVRKSIIKKYIPFIVNRINYWLKEFELFATVYIDDDFNEEIRMRGFDKTRFHSCSQGEQTRLTLSTVLAFRELLALRNKEELKFLLLDEVFENIDYNGKITLINSLKRISKENKISIIVVSHSNIDDDIFEKEISVKKQGNFSIIKS